MTMAFGPGGCSQDALDGPVLTIFAGDAVSLPLTWSQPAVLGPDGATVVVAAGPVDMTGKQPGAEFLTYGQQPGQGVALSVPSFVATAGQFTVTVPGRNQQGDLTSKLPSPSPAKPGGPRIRVHYTDAAGQHTFGTFYLAVR